MTEQRYCTNCGHQLGLNESFCQNCGRPTHETAQIPTPQANVPTPPPPQQSGYQRSGPGVWSGVKIGVGIFIVLPILIILFFFLLLLIV
jgi:uncharacterized membrane protein YvbJ